MDKFGYTGKILEVDLSRGQTATFPTDEYADRFIGGMGLAAKLYWDKVPPRTRAYDPENLLVFANGPLAGFARLAGSRWQVCGKAASMEPQFFAPANLGGSWGAWLKFAGYDAIAVQGSLEKPGYLFLHDGVVEFKDAAHLWGKDAGETQGILKAELGKGVRVVATGQAGENKVSFSTILADEGAAGSSGFGGVMASKKLKAVAVAGDKKTLAAAHPEKLAEIADRIYKLRGHHFDFFNKWAHEGKTRRQACYGCAGGCSRQTYKMDDGRLAKFFCQPADMYETVVIDYYGQWNDIVVHANDLCQRYGLDTNVVEPMLYWLAKCYREGILGEKETGLPLSKIGSIEFIDTLVRKISLREGFGDILAQGTLKAAELVGKGAGELIGDSIITRAGDLTMYDPRLFITNGLLYALEPKKPIQQIHEVSMPMHEWIGIHGSGVHVDGEDSDFISSEDIRLIAEQFWGGRTAGDFSTYEGKALAAKKIQDRVYAKESLVLCDFLWPITWARDTAGHAGDPTLESQLFSAVTGRETDQEGLDKLGERIFNLQRAIRLREGWGGREGDRLLDTFYETPLETARFNPDCLVPGKTDEPASRKGAVVDRDKFEKMKSEYYQLRGWDVPSGLPTKAKLEELGLADVAGDLSQRGLLK